MDFTPSGKPKLGYSYPSVQRRAGPAPLASFEDLPSDEQVSPEGDGDDNTLQDLSPGPEEFDHILNFDSREVLASPLKMILSRDDQSNGHRHEMASNNTNVKQSILAVTHQYHDQLLTSPDAVVTPITYSHVEDEPVSGEVTPTGFSSPTVPYTGLHYDGSARPSTGSNLLVPSGGEESGGEKSPSPDSRRKGSWTDIFFRGRSRSRSKSPIGSEGSQASPGFDRETPPQQQSSTPTGSTTNTTSSSGKTKKGFFSFLKVGRKNSTPTSSTTSTPTPTTVLDKASSIQHNQSSSSSSSTVPHHYHHVSSSSGVATPSQVNESSSTLTNEKDNCSADNHHDHRSTANTVTTHGEQSVGGKLSEQLTMPKDLNEPQESQQDIINIIEKQIEQKMFDLDVQFDLPPIHLHSSDEETVIGLSSTERPIDHQVNQSMITTKINQESVESAIGSSCEIETPLDQLTINEPNNNSTNPLPKPNLTRKLQTRSETIDDECQSLPRNFKTKETGVDSGSNVSATNVTTVEAVIEHISSEKGYSSGSDLEESSATLNAETHGKKAIYLKRQSSETSENDFEAANLLTHDSIDYEDFEGPNDLIIITPEVEERFTSLRTSDHRRRRLDVNTIPIERPRSTTPINIAPLEAFLSTASPSPDPKVEKIRLSLPEDTFYSNNNHNSNLNNNISNNRIKSPRKSNPAIWLEFCEKGLHSPKNYYRRRRANFERDFSPQESTLTSNNNNNPFGIGISLNPANTTSTTADAFTPITETPSQAVSPLTPITPLDFEDQWTPFGDNFNPYAFIKENLESRVERYKWSMECDKCDCLIGKLGSFNSNESSGCNTPGEESNFQQQHSPPPPPPQQHEPISPSEIIDDQPSLSPIACSCDCHHNFPMFDQPKQQPRSRNSSAANPSVKGQEGIYSISSDISSASSRLIQASSASSSKSSSIGEVEDKVLS